MSLFPTLPIDPILLLDDPEAVQDVLAPAGAPVLAPAPEAPAPVEAPAPQQVPEDAFPTVAEMDAIFAELAAPPPGPDDALRAELAALLGLDPALAAHAALFDAALAVLPPPAPEPDPEPPVSEEPWPGLDWAAMMRDWGDVSQGWILG